MMWIGLAIGALIGAALWGLDGAIVLGFVGWLTGVIVGSMRKPRTAAPEGDVAMEAIQARLAGLERSVKELQQQVARLSPSPYRPMAGVEERGAEEPVQPSPREEVEEVQPSPRPLPEGGGDLAHAVPEGGGELARAVPEGGGELPPEERKKNPIVAWFTEGNAIARVGLVILFFGLAFLAKYAADQDLLPVELRMAGVAGGGIALLVLGWRWRESRRGYALGLQGAGVAVLYLTTFAAYRLWDLIPPEIAFALLAFIALFSAVLALTQDAQALAVIGAGGGFLAPVLASTGEGSHVALFSFYLLINAGIVAIAWRKPWRVLNLTGFAATFLIGIVWGLEYYRPKYFATVEPFLGAFFAIYVLVAILYARRVEDPRASVDATLVFGVPLIAFGLQAWLTRDMEFALAWTALAASALYLTLSAWARRARPETWGLLAQAYFALGVVFATIAIPLALDARWTSAMWALEGAAIVWVSLRQGHRIARFFGLALQGLAALAYLESYRRGGTIPLLDPGFLGAVILAIAGIWTHRLLLVARQDATGASQAPEEPAPAPAPAGALVAAAFVWGLGWWLFAGWHELELFAPRAWRANGMVLFLAATAAAAATYAVRWDWPHARYAALGMLPVVGVIALREAVDKAHVLAHLGWLAWPAALAVHFGMLRRFAVAYEESDHTPWHAGGVWLLAIVGATELAWWAAHATGATAWPHAARAAVPAALVLLLSSTALDGRWPVAQDEHAYRKVAPAGIAIALAVWSIAMTVGHDGRATPLAYWPVLNPLDLAHLLALAALAAAAFAIRRTEGEIPEAVRSPAVIALAGAIVFAWLNAALLRTLHHWYAIPYELDDMLRSVRAQASISVFWTALALALMVQATRSGARAVWMTGAALMGVVVVKLFFLDLARVGGIERIVSFIVVGLLMLVIGYFAPVPPKKVTS